MPAKQLPGSPLTLADLQVVPANEARWEDIQVILGKSGAWCSCQRWKMPGREFFYGPIELKQAMLRAETNCEVPNAPTTGIVAYLDDEPVGWCAVEPRSNLFVVSRTPVPWKGRTEDRADPTVWAITCFTVRAGYRHRGIMKALCRAALDHALDGGARVVEGYPMITTPGQEIPWDELHVGSVSAFEEAGFELVTAPTLRRKVMKYEI